MSRNARAADRRKRREAEWQVEYEAREREQSRKDALPMYDRIEECRVDADVKDILHRMAVHVGLEDGGT